MEKGMIKKVLYLFILSFVILLIAYLGLLSLDNMYFIDDNVSLITGTPDFDHLSSRGAELWSYFLSMSSVIFDFSPLSQMVGLLFLSLTGVIVISVLNKTYSMCLVFPIVLIGLIPFISVNMLFTYDSIFMCLSILLGVIPFLFLDNTKMFFFFSFLCVLWVTVTYQTSLWVYLIMLLGVCADLYWMSGEGSSALSLGLLGMVAAFFALWIFKWCIYSPYNWHVDTVHMQSNLFENFSVSFPPLNNDIMLQKSAFFVMNLLIPMFFLVAFVYASVKNKFFSFVGACIVVWVGCVCALLMQLLYVPGGNFSYYTSYVFLLMFLSLYACVLVSKNKWLRSGGVVFFSLVVVHLSFMAAAFFNMLKHQWEYDMFNLTVVVGDLSKIIAGSESYKMEFWEFPLLEATKNNRDWKMVYAMSPYVWFNIYGSDALLESFMMVYSWEPIRKGKSSLVLDGGFYRIFNQGDFYDVDFK